MESSVGRRSFGERFVGAMRVDTSVYEEVEADGGATGQAAGVVLIVAVASAIGGVNEGGWIYALVASLLGWLLWSAVTYVVGDWILRGTATWGELLRTIGFAMAPGVLYVFGIVPILGWIVELIVGIWLLVTVVVAIRQALDFGTGRAILTALLGWIPYMLLLLFARGIFGVTPDLLP